MDEWQPVEKPDSIIQGEFNEERDGNRPSYRKRLIDDPDLKNFVYRSKRKFSNGAPTILNSMEGDGAYPGAISLECCNHSVQIISEAPSF
ncbi:MAG: hypothetical protein K9N46_11525 [Candidatus Marinimicrobia bacterium]|nr:hypothetical protein [Candidatus Neomarinimicrobiota bacterium]MCF7827409.1 hypothetical protein [Candidatus Neomarinimicrobiota bacterium]MCF7881358.1 hypothetical protein [Candidatus Neomarinimicrobiota bacterium]